MSITASRRVNIASIALALAVAVFLTINLSVAAFTDTTESPDNFFATGNVEITNDEEAGVVFNANNIVPGWSQTETITTTNNSTVVTDVGMYFDIEEDNGLAEHLQVTVLRAGAPLYSGALDSLPADFAASTTEEEAGSGNQVAYEITVELPSTAGNEAQNADVTVTFVWEAQSQ